MVEKQASSEIAQSRERFEKAFAEKRELDVTPNTTVYAVEFPYADIVCFIATGMGHIPRPIYVAAAVVAYYAMTGGGW